QSWAPLVFLSVSTRTARSRLIELRTCAYPPRESAPCEAANRRAAQCLRRHSWERVAGARRKRVHIWLFILLHIPRDSPSPPPGVALKGSRAKRQLPRRVRLWTGPSR